MKKTEKYLLPNDNLKFYRKFLIAIEYFMTQTEQWVSFRNV